MAVKEFEIIIDKKGQIKFQVKGIKGSSCIDFSRAFEEALGQIVKQELTGEYYENDNSITTSVGNK